MSSVPGDVFVVLVTRVVQDLSMRPANLQQCLGEPVPPIQDCPVAGGVSRRKGAVPGPRRWLWRVPVRPRSPGGAGPVNLRLGTGELPEDAARLHAAGRWRRVAAADRPWPVAGGPAGTGTCALYRLAPAQLIATGLPRH